MSEIDNQQFNQLNRVSCGEVVHLQIITATKPIRLKTRLIGVDPNMSIILAFGNDTNWERALPHIKESRHVVVRLLSNEQQQAKIIAFRCQIQKLMTVAGRWLVLNYPKTIESADLRQHLRIAVKIEASLLDSASNTILAIGKLTDISIQGCAFIGQREPTLHVNSVYRLVVKLEDDNSTIDLSVALKNIQNSTRDGEVQYGLVFMKPDSETKESIQQLLLHHLQQ